MVATAPVKPLPAYMARSTTLTKIARAAEALEDAGKTVAEELREIAGQLDRARDELADKAEEIAGLKAALAMVSAEVKDFKRLAEQDGRHLEILKAEVTRMRTERDTARADLPLAATTAAKRPTPNS